MKNNIVARTVIAGAMIIAASNASAAQVWVDGFTVKSSSLYWDGAGSWVVSVFVNEPVNTGCAKGDADGVFSYWASGANLVHQMILSSAIAAKAQDLKVALLMENSICGAGAGRHINGIRTYE